MLKEKQNYSIIILFIVSGCCMAICMLESLIGKKKKSISNCVLYVIDELKITRPEDKKSLYSCIEGCLDSLYFYRDEKHNT